MAITYRDENKSFEPVGVFTIHSELNSIINKVKSKTQDNHYLDNLCFVASKFNTNNLFKDYEDYTGHERRMSSNVLKFNCFKEHPDNTSDIEVYGVLKNKRQHKFIDKKYVDMSDDNIGKFKIILPKADGSGAFGDTLTYPEILKPNTGFTHTFMGIGGFDTIEEANAALKYLKSKFARVMLSILKVTQDNTPDKWKYVPMQDFTENSDINWSVSVAEIDRQLYKKYGLSEEEISFIETHVKEME
ncbi:MAG: restriction endonuclease [Clostridiales bacterium]|nr:restriction endonuclease [Clostridiales bacterium]